MMVVDMTQLPQNWILFLANVEQALQAPVVVGDFMVYFRDQSICTGFQSRDVSGETEQVLVTGETALTD